MATAQRTVTVIHSQGLHARPAALFVQVAKRFSCAVTVKKGRKIVDGKSIMGLLTLAAGKGARIAIVTNGSDAAAALEKEKQQERRAVPLKTLRSFEANPQSGKQQ
jgi:phosphotransferase system HPr (HPr) family protein